VTYWLTRDMTAGELSEVVEVWGSRPEATITRHDNGLRTVTWLCDSEALDAGARHGEWFVDAARDYCGPGVPDDERQCTRVEGEPPLDRLQAYLGSTRRARRDTEPL
jgi:hypothetical protein